MPTEIYGYDVSFLAIFAIPVVLVLFAFYALLRKTNNKQNVVSNRNNSALPPLLIRFIDIESGLLIICSILFVFYILTKQAPPNADIGYIAVLVIFIPILALVTLSSVLLLRKSKEWDGNKILVYLCMVASLALVAAWFYIMFIVVLGL